MMAIAMPLCLGLYSDSLSPTVVALLIIASVQHDFAAAPGGPPSAIVAASGWITPGTMLKIGMVQALLSIVFIYFVGSGLGALIV